METLDLNISNDEQSYIRVNTYPIIIVCSTHERPASSYVVFGGASSLCLHWGIRIPSVICIALKFDYILEIPNIRI